ncbi:U3 small nucleolar RNA-associated protein 15 homolog [Tetranychus urticae]|uniref:U3 small nucleolar RNA-associated protein 15 homolog n=1 Tax=Tetranychus urticae TaxID=32264 RepID=T1K0Z1_TETUR|nr:U3 small nucleolar RNA-associated protein 15 homolog [Tetranychus urticae]
MTDFKETSDVTIPKIKEPLTSDAFYWQHVLEQPKIVKEAGIIDKLDLNAFNNDLLVTSRDRISIYNVNNLELKRTYQSVSSRKVDFVRWASYRKTDCKLFTSSTDEGRINIFDVDNSKPLRVMSFNSPQAHTNSVRKSEFISYNQVISFSDDKHIKIWDIADGAMVQEIGSDESNTKTAHEDYIRAGCVFDQGSLLVASGSYDHTVKLWDIREKSLKPTHQFNLNNPVESLITRGTFLIAAASKTVKIIDLVAGKVMQTLPNLHSKTITTLWNYDDFWFTGSLDGIVKIFDTYFSLVTSLNFVPTQLLSMAVNSKAFSVGAADGTVISRRFKSKDNEEKVKELLNAHIIRKQQHQRYFQLQPDDEDFNEQFASMDDDTLVVKDMERKKLNLQSYDKKLKKYHHAKALDLTLQRAAKKPEIVVSMMQELSRRGTLRASLAGRDDQGFRCIANFLIKNIRDPRFNRVLVDVAIIFCDIYRSSIQSSKIQAELFKRMKDEVEAEEKCLKLMMNLSGQIDMLLNNSFSN